MRHTHDDRRTDYLPLESTPSLAAALRLRARRTPHALAYRQFDPARERWVDTSWSEMARETARWRAALAAEGLGPGERVAISLRNCREWACFDLAAQSLGLVTVPLYTNDRPDSMAFILGHSGARVLLLCGNDDCAALGPTLRELPDLRRVLTLERVRLPAAATAVEDWLPADGGELEVADLEPGDLATIVYTSGTTGRPKGVMLSHRNILRNVHSGLALVRVAPDDLFLSFLPLSHALERTVGLYLPLVAGAGVAYSRSPALLAEDLKRLRPTILVAVPRVFERVYARVMEKVATGPAPARLLFGKAVDIGWQRFLHAKGQAPQSAALALAPLLDRLVGARVRGRLGGRLRLAVSGGAPLAPQVARLFLALGINVIQGYGLTEFSPMVAGNPPRDNRPDSVGPPLAGAEVRIGAQDEILVRGPSLMLGYWRDPEATAAAVDPQGWLHTGDKGRLEDGYLYITGRIKEVIVLANGEKVSPTDMELAIALDPLADQVLVLGEGRPYLTALMVPDPEGYAALLQRLRLPPDTPYDDPAVEQAVLQRVGECLRHFPGYARVLRVRLVPQPWTVDNDLMTPTMKLRRDRILERHAADVELLYAGHR